MPKINLNITDLETEKAELTAFLSNPEAYSDPAYSSKNRRLSELDGLIDQAHLRDQLEHSSKKLRNCLVVVMSWPIC